MIRDAMRCAVECVRPAGSALALALALLAAMGSAPAPLPAWAAPTALAAPALPPEPSRASGAAPLETRVDALLAEAGLHPERMALLLFSTRERRYLYRRNIHRPMIAASNTKLVTTYAALRVLSPDYRWRTRFSRVEEHDDPGAATRQGLLVEADGDPTITSAELRQVAWELRSRGVVRLDGGLYFDARRFDDERFPASWGDVSRAQPWFAPVSPFIVNGNVVPFLIGTRYQGAGFDIYTAAQGYRIVSELQQAPEQQPSLRVEQSWSGDSATFTVRGSLAPSAEPYQFSAAVGRPVAHFYQQLRAALREAGIQGEMPLGAGLPAKTGEPIYSLLSPPLREVLVEVNKHSNNLGAEVLLRTMGLVDRSERVTAADGLAVLHRAMERAFSQAGEELRLVDGSGLSRANHVSALLLVRLLNRVRTDPSLRPEFINSLSVALTDGTLHYRGYPPRLRGRLRAKSGTLAGVSNLSGYLQLDRDVIVFSFLVHDPGRRGLELQEAQDGAMAALYDVLLEREAALRVSTAAHGPSVSGPSVSGSSAPSGPVKAIGLIPPSPSPRKPYGPAMGGNGTTVRPGARPAPR